MVDLEDSNIVVNNASTLHASVERTDTKKALDTGDKANLHVVAENKSENAAIFKMYFCNVGDELSDDTSTWSEYLNKPALDMKVQGLDENCTLPVDMKDVDGKTVPASLEFVKEVKDDEILSRFTKLELPAGASIDFEFSIMSDKECDVTVIPVMVQETPVFGDADSATWEENITFFTKVVNFFTGKTAEEEDDGIELSDVQGIEIEADTAGLNEADFKSKEDLEGEDSAKLNDDIDLSADFYDRYATDGADAKKEDSKPKLVRSNLIATLLSGRAIGPATSMQRLSVDITKRTQWTDESNGNGKITLQYASNSGSLTGMKDLDVVLIQDKSGSMDANYGYNVETKNRGWSATPDASEWYPIDPNCVNNGQAWSETVSDIAKNEGETNYLERLNYKDGTDPNKHWGIFGYWLNSTHMTFNSPCQYDNHYYFLTKSVATSNDSLPAWSMVHGNNLYNISATDLHHYIKVDRDTALSYLSQGRRVVRMTSGVYYNEGGTPRRVSGSNPVYFLDVTQLAKRGNYWLLNTCALSECQDNDRLSRSQEFMVNLIQKIQSVNASSRIAYIPFWGDVPNNGDWSNVSSNGTTDGLFPDNSYGNTQRLTHEDGVTKMNFSTDYNSIINQINNDFTYDGTNWARSFQAAINYLENRSTEDKKKETLVIFLTDGVPQGTAGLPADVDNKKINGDNEIAQLKAMDNVTLYSFGVCINRQDTAAKSRLDNVDSSNKATLARTLSEFSKKEQKILDRLSEQYTITISGNNAFYSDTLSGPFSLDESKINSEWKVLASPGNGITFGVPTSVYDAARTHKYIYVRSTKTIYWHIGNMTDGSFSSYGHSMSFPIKYANYQTSTSSTNLKLASNTGQKMTYISTQNPNQVEEVTMQVPTIIFNRQDRGQIAVSLTAASAWDIKRSYRFVVTDTAQSGKVNASAIIQDKFVDLPAGQTSTNVKFQNLIPGTYYVYRTDNIGNIIEQRTGIELEESAAITTKAYSGTYPRSATTSNGSILNNLDNVLTIVTTSAAVTFSDNTEYVDVGVSKVWDDGNYAGRPTEVTVWLLQNGTKMKSLKLNAKNLWKGTFEHLEKYDKSGKEYQYTVEEEDVLGYDDTIEEVTDNNYRITNKLLRGSVKLVKYDADGKTFLKGVQFELKNSKGVVVSTATTNSKGEVVFNNLLPDVYTITETKTVAGHSLLKEPLKVTIPMTFTKQEVVDQKVDTSKCVYYPEKGVYQLYDFTYEITNTPSFQIPMTGGLLTPVEYIPLAAGVFMLMIVAIMIYRRKREA